MWNKKYSVIAYDRNITACFTGHRTYDGYCNEELRCAVRELYARGYRIFLSGMAVGFDHAAAEVVLQLREELPDISLVAVLPFEGVERNFSEKAKAHHNAILAAADEVIALASRYSAGVYAVRNNFLVDNSSATIAYFDGSKGGTAYTVRRTIKALHRYINLYISPQQELFDSVLGVKK